MARPTRRADEASPRDLHELGVRGRKTGATLRDRGRRDEYGMLPLADISSSPVANTAQDKVPAPVPAPAPVPVPVPAPAAEVDRETTPDHGGNDSGSDAMEIASSAGPGPQTILRERAISYGLPKSRSPIKTKASSFRSPAKRNPNLSPLRTSNTPTETSIVRQPDFVNPPALSGGSKRSAVVAEPRSDDSNSMSGGDGDTVINSMVAQLRRMPNGPAERYIQTAKDYRPRMTPQGAVPVSMSDKARGKQKAVPSKLLAQASPGRPASARHSSPPQPPVQYPESSLYVPNDPDPSPSPEPAPPQPPVQYPESSLYVPNDPDPSPSPEPAPPQYSSSPPAPVREPSITKPPPRLQPQKRRALAISTTGEDVEDGGRKQEKRQRRAESAVSRSEQPVKRGRGRPPKNGVAKRGRGRPRKSEVESDGEEGESLMTLQRGPPMPKSRGLVSMRRDATSAVEDRSRGRSYNDADWWVDIQGNEAAYEPELPRGKRAGPQGAGATKGRRRPAAAMADEDDELEDWELDPGIMTGEIVLWEPEHEENPPGPDDPVQVTDERIAITADAIQTYEIRDSDARYAKALTMPFMGAGLVDLPPGSEKRPKNSRKMHLVFFVHYGKVTVSINEVQFRISAGGMWFVPRGNYYNIANDNEFPARVYFAQACEMSSSAGMEDMTQQTIIT